MNTPAHERILIVDDDERIRRALQNALTAKGYAVEEAASGEDALKIAAENPPGMVVLDLAMPGQDGFQVCKELRQWSKVPILVLSVKDRESDKVTALDLGADDYLTKPFNTEELLARVRAHLRRSKERPEENAIIQMDGLKVDIPRHAVSLHDQQIKLTKTEFALLQYLIQNRGRVMTYRQILSHVWGTEYENDTQTLRVHAGRLRQKIESDPGRPRFILTEPGVGYRFSIVS